MPNIVFNIVDPITSITRVVVTQCSNSWYYPPTPAMDLLSCTVPSQMTACGCLVQTQPLPWAGFIRHHFHIAEVCFKEGRTLLFPVQISCTVVWWHCALLCHARHTELPRMCRWNAAPCSNGNRGLSSMEVDVASKSFWWLPHPHVIT